MPAAPEDFDIKELADRASVTVRTVRYYIQQGLLPAPD
jgi:DNA-binding transcriptional MerR regulator